MGVRLVAALAGLHRRQLTYGANTVPKTGHTRVRHASVSSQGRGPGRSPPLLCGKQIRAGTMAHSLLYLLFCWTARSKNASVAPLRPQRDHCAAEEEKNNLT